jgi:hypothetical protein
MTTKKDIFNILPYPIEWKVNAIKELDAYYARQKQEYMLKYNLTELKQNKTKTALEAWNS